MEYRNNYYCFLELGSLSTQLKLQDSKSDFSSIESFINPLSIIDLSGKINPDIFKAKILEKLVAFSKAHSLPHKNIYAIATGIYRNASNSKEILKLLNEFGLKNLKLLSAEDESKLSFQSYYDKHKTAYQDIIYIDLGGGSTEVAYFENETLKQCIPIKVGVLHLVHSFLLKPDSLVEGVMRLNPYILHQISKYEDSLKMLLNGKQKVVVTGSLVKNIHKKYTNENIVEISQLEAFIDYQSEKIGRHNYFNLGQAKKAYKKTTNRNEINYYVGLSFLKKLLEKIGVNEFEINDEGLSLAFPHIFPNAK